MNFDRNRIKWWNVKLHSSRLFDYGKCPNWLFWRRLDKLIAHKPWAWLTNLFWWFSIGFLFWSWIFPPSEGNGMHNIPTQGMIRPLRNLVSNDGSTIWRLVFLRHRTRQTFPLSMAFPFDLSIYSTFFFLLRCEQRISCPSVMKCGKSHIQISFEIKKQVIFSPNKLPRLGICSSFDSNIDIRHL